MYVIFVDANSLLYKIFNNKKKKNKVRRLSAILLLSLALFSKKYLFEKYLRREGLITINDNGYLDFDKTMLCLKTLRCDIFVYLYAVFIRPFATKKPNLHNIDAVDHMTKL